ncbi:MAG: DUF4340 domain-containing protein [Candidatus Eisenbacteria bacterium]|nr:DUF4340 domain-containing protein [Candidatus Eisenbacteria bacterium]
MVTGRVRRRPLGALQWLLILVAVLLLVLWIRTLRQGDAEPAGEAWRAPLRKGEGASVTALRLLRDPQLLALRRDGGAWWLVEPLEDLASVRMVRELFRALENLEIRRRLPGDDLARYGLDPPRAVLRLQLRDGSTRTLRIGDAAPASGDTYATWSHLPGVALIPRFVVARFFQSELLSWRETEMLPPASAGVDSVWVILPDARIRIERQQPDVWRFLAPADREADGIDCERAVAAFWRFPFQRFIDDPQERQAIARATPRARWIVFRGDRRDTLRIVRRVQGTQMIVQHTARAPGLADGRLFDLLTGGVEALEVRRLLRGTSAQIEQLLVVGMEGHRHYWRAAGGWQTGRLSSEALAAADAGRPPPADARRPDGRAPGTFESELRNLFWLEGEAWLPARDTSARPSAYPLRIHLWDAAGTHRWAFFRPEAGRSLAGMQGDVFAGVGLGSRSPRRPLRLRSDLVGRWALRAAGEAGAPTR